MSPKGESSPEARSAEGGAVTPDEYCQKRTAESGTSFYYSFLFLPPDRRRAITALYAFCREVDDVVDEVADPDLARTKLAWWRQEIGAVFNGTPQHPVGLALSPVVAQFRLPREHFDTIIDGMAMDLDRNRYLDFADLERYCHCVAGVVGLMSAEIFGYVNPATRQYARDLGIAFQLTNIVPRRRRGRAPRADLPAAGRARAPRRHPGVVAQARDDAGNGPADGRAGGARAPLASEALDELPPEDRRTQRPGLIMAAIYRALLDEIERDGYAVLDHRIALTPLRKLWLAWTTARRG
jgi:phytoene synthase